MCWLLSSRFLPLIRILQLSLVPVFRASLFGILHDRYIYHHPPPFPQSSAFARSIRFLSYLIVTLCALG